MAYDPHQRDRRAPGQPGRDSGPFTPGRGHVRVGASTEGRWTPPGSQHYPGPTSRQGAGLPGFPASPPQGPSGPTQSSSGGGGRGRRRGIGIGGALLAALVGGLVASVVTAGAFLAVDDAEPSNPIGEPVGIEQGEPLDIGELLAVAQPSVVSIHTDQQTPDGVFGGAGSGVIISDDGLVLTNAHVIGTATTVSITLYDGREAEADLVGSIPEEDVAVVQMVDPPEVEAADLGSSADLRVGDPVVAIGNALNLGGPPSVTQGIVSAKDRTIEAAGQLELTHLIQTDAAINPGNSGGALLNAYGEVVGINTAIISDAQNIGFAIAIDAIKPLIDEIAEGGAVITPDGAFLGIEMVSVRDLLDGVRSEYGVTADEGVFVSRVEPGTAAEEAGLELGDVIREVNGESVELPSDVATAVRNLEPGDEMSMLIERQGGTEERTATLGTRADAGN